MDSSQKKGMIPVSPSHTPRSTEKIGRDLRSAEGNGNASGKFDKEKGVNVQVILRCRPLSEEEMRMNTPIVISCNEYRREVAAVQNIANKQIDRTFVFDKVFGPTSKQKDLFDQAISPIVNEVLEGYNCTIFAYGQTGTGKTYTMEGGSKAKNGEFPSDAGVIPRAVRQIFSILEAQCAEYSMKVTFLELYNEEITDLLTLDDSKFSDDKSKKPIALMEDGKGGVFVRGLEEEVVYTASEIYKILDKGSTKRRTAETLLNKQSSRSHSIFSITIHIKEYTHEGEEMIKCGKLNLVDLAGSENISRSGARDGRAREAGEINKSLLTLGRVINALVEHSGHIPYRDSKLTRLLRDSLGGKTKTCIIATVSPSIHCLEETLSTLDYAHRAKNIKNKPEVNQKMLKSAVIKDLYTEIDRLKQEVFAAREKNGIYIPKDRFLLEEAEKKAMTEKIEHLELDLDLKDKKLVGLQELYNSQQLLNEELSENLKQTKKKLEETEHALFDIEERYRQATSKIKEKEFFISNLLQSEKLLVERAHELRSELESATVDISGLFSKIGSKDKIEDGNRILVQKFQSQLTQQLEILHKTVSVSVMQQDTQLKRVGEGMQLFVSIKAEATKGVRGHVERLKALYGSGIKALDDLSGELDKNSLSTFGILNSQVQMHSSTLEDCFKGISLEADQLLHELQASLSEQEDKLVVFVQQQREAHLRTVEATRAISRIASNFFDTLDIHASSLTKIFNESQTMQDKQLLELEKKFEECAANEEKQMLEKVAEMLASSSARKTKLVQAAVDNLRASAAQRTSCLEKEMSTAHNSSSSVKEQWKTHMEETEAHYVEDIEGIETGKLGLDDGFRNCMEKAKLSSKQWKTAQSSLLNLDKGNMASVDSIVRNGLEANQRIHCQLSMAASATLEDVETANKDLHSSIERSLKLDHEACEDVNGMLSSCREELWELKSGHCHKIVEITENTGKCFEEEYMVDMPSCSTPRRRSINLPGIAFIEELRTPAFEELLQSFWAEKSAPKEINEDLRQCTLLR
ncbi:kinesin-like protein KIN-5A isoform X2 [Curcuma longa]|uniref:kinesin-like protein KIN-5A isoform X2 n=1 Tax=Curcuma longa TaxID=136217 RepID=UPI003D9E60B6